MPADRFSLIAAVYLILQRDGDVLLLRRFNTGYEDGNFSLIAGHLDGNEPLQQAMAREAREEAGIEIQPADLELVHVLHRYRRAADGSDDERIEFFFTTSQWQGEIAVMEPEKCDLLEWYPLHQLPGNTIPYIAHVLNQVEQGIITSAFGWEELA